MVFNYCICFRNHIKKYEIENETTHNGISSWNEEEEEESDDLDLQSWRRFFPYGNKMGFNLIKTALPLLMDTHTLLPVP